MAKNYCLIIGASSDVGCQLIRKMDGLEFTILAHYNSGLSKLEKLKGECKVEIIPISADLSAENGALDLIKSIQAYIPDIAQVVHLSAPKPENKRFKDVLWSDFQQDFDVQIKSAVMILKEILPKMALRKKGKVLLMSSSVTMGVPYKNLVPYVTAKYALVGLTKALAAEYADKNIQINTVSPSLMETSFLSNTPQKAVEFAAESHPLKRNAKPEDVVPLMIFLLSPQADFITGANIPVTGGLQF